jgi:hypothetical protein
MHLCCHSAQTGCSSAGGAAPELFLPLHFLLLLLSVSCTCVCTRWCLRTYPSPPPAAAAGQVSTPGLEAAHQYLLSVARQLQDAAIQRGDVSVEVRKGGESSVQCAPAASVDAASNSCMKLCSNHVVCQGPSCFAFDLHGHCYRLLTLASPSMHQVPYLLIPSLSNPIIHTLHSPCHN